MSKKRKTQLNFIVFFILIAATLPWQDAPQESVLRADLAPGQPLTVGFTAADSTLLLQLQSAGLDSSRLPANLHSPLDKHLDSLFGKLVLAAMLEMAAGKSSDSLLALAAQCADALAAWADDPFLQRQLSYYTALAPREVQRLLYAESKFSQAQKLGNQHNKIEAISRYASAARIFAQLGDRRRQVDAEFAIVTCAFESGDYATAKAHASNALTLAAAGAYKAKKRWLDFYLGVMAYTCSDFDLARQHFRSAADEGEAAQDTELLVQLDQYFGFVDWRQGKFYQALDYLKRSEFRNDGRSIHTSISNHNMVGSIYRNLGEFDAAAEHFAKAYELNQSLKNKRYGAMLTNNWAAFYEELGDLQRARDMYATALAAEEQQRDPQLRHIITYLSNIGTVDAKLQQFDSALAYQNRALEALQTSDLFEAEKAMININIGMLHQEMGDLTAARRCYKTARDVALRINDKKYIFAALHGLGNIALQSGDIDGALASQQQALAFAQATASPRLLAASYLALGRSHEAGGDARQAFDFFDKAVEVVEKSRTRITADSLKMSFFASHLEGYNRLIRLCLEQYGDPALALHYSERSRARTITDILGERYGRIVDDGQIPDLTTFRQHLRPEVVLIEYKIFDDQLAIWSVSRDSLAAIMMPISRAALADTVQHFLDVIGANPQTFDAFRQSLARDPRALQQTTRELGNRLYEILLQPVAEQLSRANTVYIVPDDVLFYLPFAALSLRLDGKWHYALERHRLVQVPSLAAYHMLELRQQQRPAREARRLFVVGNPSGNLPDSEKEARAIAAMFPEHTLLLHEAASEAAVVEHLQAGAAIFHFAGHGRINERSPMFSTLELYGQTAASTLNGNGGVYFDGRLTVHDLMQVDLRHLQLATLSGCETGLGGIVKGEGMMGLSQALLGGGVPRLVASLWRIDDRLTRHVMTRFYRYLQHDGLGTLDALRQTQLEVMRGELVDTGVDVPLPYFWAPYLLIGLED